MAVGYAQAQPTEAAMIAALEEVLGDDGVVVWDSTCERAKVVRPVADVPALLLVAELLTASDIGLARVAGRSIVIRLASYQALDQQGML